MKVIRESFFFLLLFLFFQNQSFSQETKQVLKITNLKKVKGRLYIGWYNDATTFLKYSKTVYRDKIEVNNQTEINVLFKNIPKGKYAIAVFLDENDNYRLDKNFLGIPKEKYGFSNNVLPAFRSATFEEAAFELKQQDAELIIKLK